jgi:hypothetical protein
MLSLTIEQQLDAADKPLMAAVETAEKVLKA